jgi:hypothetical protein
LALRHFRNVFIQRQQGVGSAPIGPHSIGIRPLRGQELGDGSKESGKLHIVLWDGHRVFRRSILQRSSREWQLRSGCALIDNGN